MIEERGQRVIDLVVSRCSQPAVLCRCSNGTISRPGTTPRCTALGGAAFGWPKHWPPTRREALAERAARISGAEWPSNQQLAACLDGAACAGPRGQRFWWFGHIGRSASARRQKQITGRAAALERWSRCGLTLR